MRTTYSVRVVAKALCFCSNSATTDEKTAGFSLVHMPALCPKLDDASKDVGTATFGLSSGNLLRSCFSAAKPIC